MDVRKYGRLDACKEEIVRTSTPPHVHAILPVPRTKPRSCSMQLDVLQEETTTSKWSIPLSRTMAVPAEKIWETITTPEVLEKSHPFVKKNPTERWSGVGSTDMIYYYSGMTLTRRITRWIDGVGYDLEATDEEGRTSHVTWRIHDVDGASSTLTIAILPYLFEGAPGPLRWLPHHLYLRPMITRYLDSVLKGFEAYITTGEAVRRNQFGSHYVFSPRIKGENYPDRRAEIS